MEELRSLFDLALQAWRGLPLGDTERRVVWAVIVLAFFHALVAIVEVRCRVRTDNYRSREYAHDVFFWFYYRSGLNWMLFMVVIFTWLDQFKTPLDLQLLVDYPMWFRAIVFFMIAEFIGYWWHRANHEFKFLWAFHSMHHAPKKITFATSARFHPVEIILQYCWFYALIRILGGSPLSYLPLFIVMELVLEAQHTQIPWKLGRWYKVLVTPTYHAYHHSADPTHYNKNYAVIFSFFDYIFGTAVPDDSPVPKRLGLPDLEMPTILSSFVTPFRLAYESFGSGQPSAPPPEDLASESNAGSRT